MHTLYTTFCFILLDLHRFACLVFIICSFVANTRTKLDDFKYQQQYIFALQHLNMYDQGQQHFLPIFTEISQKQCEHPTLDAIPDSPFQFNYQVEQIFSKPNPICIVTVVWSSQQAIRYARTALLQQQPECKEEKLKHQDSNIGENFHVFQKIMQEYNRNGQSINLAYFEINYHKQLRYLPIISAVSCIIIYQKNCIENDRIYLQKTINNFKEITGRSPSIFYLVKDYDHQASQIKQRYGCQIIQMIEKSEQKIEGEQSYFQNAIQSGRAIVNDCFLLQTESKKVIPCSAIPVILKKWDQQINYGQTESFSSIVSQSLKILIEQSKQYSLQQYKTRMLKLYEDKKFISMKLLKSSHQISAEIALKSLEKLKLQSQYQNLKQETEQLINKQLNKIIEQVVEINYKWGKNFIQTQFSQIQNRIKSRDLKLASSLKNQFVLFIDYFHKKAETLSCRKLQYFFEQFILDKIFECSTHIYESQKKIYQTQSQELKNKLSLSESEVKQLKKQLLKENISSQKQIQILSEKLTNSKNKQKLLQQTITQLKQNIIQIEKEEQKKLQQICIEYSQQINSLRDEKLAISQQVSAAKRRICSLQSQISKQKQMHELSNQHYRTLLNQCKEKQIQLRQQIQQIAHRTNLQLQYCKRQSERQLSISTFSKTEKQKQGHKLQEQIKSLHCKYNQLEKTYNNLQYEYQLKKAQHQIQKNDIEVNLKIAEQKICQYESRLPRFQKLEQELNKHQQIVAQSNQQLKNISTESALLKQQNNFMAQRVKELSTKVQTERNENEELKASLQEVEQKVTRMQSKVFVNEWVQTEVDNDVKLRNTLQQALKMVGILQNQYNKMKLENKKMKFRMGDY